MDSQRELRNCDHFTLLLDETRDVGTQSELSLIARIIKNVVFNHFLDLFQLPRGDAETIFQTVDTLLRKESTDIKNMRFSGMDECSTMTTDHKGIKNHLESSTPHFTYIHCINHGLTLCFAHLIPQYKVFENFDSLLLNSSLSMKNSSVKQAIFEEGQSVYELISLKFNKAAVTRWLSHGKAVQRVLDKYEALVAALFSLHEKKGASFFMSWR